MELGFIGLGQMGSRMAIRLLDAGHSLTVFDREAVAGVQEPYRHAAAHLTETDKS